MEITNSKSKDQIIKECIKFLDHNLFLSKSEKLQFTTLFCEYCLNDLNVNNINVSVVELENTSGATINNDITLSIKELKKHSQVELFNTIAHEIRHVYQNSLPPKLKDFNNKFTISYPLHHIPSQITFITFDEHLNMFDYYVTSTVETDARSYANSVLEKFLNTILKNTNKNHRAHKWAKYNIKKHNNYKQNETKKFTNSFYAVKNTYSQLKYETSSKFQNIIDLVQSDNSKSNRELIKNYISNILYIYCDDKLTNKLFDYCIKYNDKQSLIELIQHPNTNITDDMFKTYIKTFCKNDVTLDVLCQTFTNWQPNSLKHALKLAYPENIKNSENTNKKIANKKNIKSDVLKKQFKLFKSYTNDNELQK